MKKLQPFWRVAAILGIITLAWISWPSTPDAVHFNSDIRPLLTQKCMKCHGGVRQLGGFSLLFREQALDTTASGLFAIVPGLPDSSELIRRVSSNDPDERMPAEKPPLSQQEIDLLRRWIAEGAEWQRHWTYDPPQKPNPPAVNDAWTRNTIDTYILNRMQQHGLSPSDAAPKAKLLRRASLDLTGLPPTLEQLEQFESDDSDSAYAELLDRLLASPAYGERWTAMWLDLARYADSKGYEKDDVRHIWKYRDWVIDAFNADMPFDQFTIEQLAGDLLPDATLSQKIATAFHRNTMTNDEGGTDNEEFRVAAVIDRVNTTWEVWQGTTMACVQCHTHPYDPFRHKEYYQSFAFFNNTADADRPDETPVLEVWSQEQSLKRTALQARLDSMRGLQSTAAKNLKTQLESIRPARLPVMAAMPEDKRRTTQVFDRGNFLVKGDTVQATLPAIFAQQVDASPQDRLAFAEWLVSDRNPLTARVLANRIWEQLFGRGIVLTLEDFGSQMEPPTHPQLLDALAWRLMHVHRWHLKPFLREIMLSATYRQDSRLRTGDLEKDPQNLYLARAPRIRLSAEQLRDQALAVSGLLSRKMYGPSVKPYQPPGIWQVIYSGATWKQSDGEDRYRRGLYTWWRRTSPYPSMIAFDTPSREFCVSRRVRTNTPLQALVTLNDPVYVEAARHLAADMIARHPDATASAIQHGYRRALLQQPSQEALDALLILYDEARVDLQKKARAPDTVNSKTPAQEAMFLVANSILNLDAFIMKE